MPNIRSLSVQSKLIVAFLALTLTAIGVISWIGYASARQSLRAAAERELLGLQRSKSALVKNILKSARNEASQPVGIGRRRERRAAIAASVPATRPRDGDAGDAGRGDAFLPR